MGLRSLVAQYLGGPVGAQMVSSHDEKYANTGAENPYLENIINQSNHSGVSKWGAAVGGAIGEGTDFSGKGGGLDNGGIGGTGLSTGSELGDKAISSTTGKGMSKFSGGAKGSANHKDMFNQPIGEDSSMGKPTWSKDTAADDILKQKMGNSDEGGKDNSVNLFGNKYANAALNASLPESWKDNIAPWTPQNIYGTAMSGAASGVKSLFGSSASAESDDGDIDLD